MKRSSEFNSYNPLYLISSPIGNLSDITERQKEVLNTLDILYCEDTRVTKKLLEHLSIEKLSLDSYHDFSEDTKIDKIVSEIKSGLKVGLISDAGNPVISDPGYEVVRRLVSEDIRVIPVPGISAYTTALTISTIPPKPHMFYGFLSSNDKKRKEELEEIKDYPFTIIFYESPHRIKKTLKDMYNILGDRCVSLSRELTKVYEETIYFSLSEHEKIGDDLKGEMVIVLEGKKKEESQDKSIDEILDELELLIKNGKTIKEASKELSNKYNVKSSDLYNEYIRSRK